MDIDRLAAVKTFRLFVIQLDGAEKVLRTGFSAREAHWQLQKLADSGAYLYVKYERGYEAPVSDN